MGVLLYQALDFDALKKCSRRWRTHSDSVLTVEHSLVAFQTPRSSGTARGGELGANREDIQKRSYCRRKGLRIFRIT